MLDPDRTDAPGRPDRRPIEVVLVTAPRCHLCADAANLLDDLGSRYRLAVRQVELASDEGVGIATGFRVPFPPVLLLNGTYFGHGRISRRKLTMALDNIVGADMPR